MASPKAEGRCAILRSTPILKAFSLAEILVFLATVTIAILGLISVQVYSLRCSVYNRSRHTAGVLLESILSQGTAQLSRDFNQDLSYSQQAIAYQADFKSSLQCVYEPDPGGDLNLKRLTAAVYWQDSNPLTQRSLEGWTYVYRVH